MRKTRCNTGDKYANDIPRLLSLILVLLFTPARSRLVAYVHELNAMKEHWQTLKHDEDREAFTKERQAFNAAVNKVRVSQLY